jgi:hypothetical protein
MLTDEICASCKEGCYPGKKCPKCGSCPKHHEVRNYSMMWHEGDIHCNICESYVRLFDAG